MNNNVLIIISGTSGSGKSTFADFLEFMIDGCEIEICTADDYFMIDGEYKFDASKHSKAHKWCQEKCDASMAHSVGVVIVANTSTSRGERQIYLDMAEKRGYSVVSLILENVNETKNVHGVPEHVLERQKQKLIDSLK